MGDSTSNHTSATETTALLGPAAERNAPIASSSVTPISQGILRLQSCDLTSVVTCQDICPSGLTSRDAQTAYALTTLLQTRLNKLRLNQSSRDIWDQWSRANDNAADLNILDATISRIWSGFLKEYATSREIEMVLWKKYPLDEENNNTIGVIDFLTGREAPSVLVSDQVVYLSLLNTWNLGLYPPSVSSESIFARLADRYDAFGTPRALHAIDLMTRLGTVALLISYVLHPPPRPTIYLVPLEYMGWREVLILLFSASFVARLRPSNSIPFILTILAFIFTLPSVPFPEDMSFTILLLAVSLHIIQLHLPLLPGPLYILPPNRSLPLAFVFKSGFGRILTPTIAFFLPAFLLSTYMLSFSLADTFLRSFLVSSISTVVPTPMETRAVFLILPLLVFITAASSFFILGNAIPPISESELAGWDRYSRPIGHVARQSFYRAVVAYSAPFSFPAPFNLIQLVLIRVPLFLLQFFGLSGELCRKIERGIWRVFVGPVAVAAAMLAWFIPAASPN